MTRIGADKQEGGNAFPSSGVSAFISAIRGFFLFRSYEHKRTKATKNRHAPRRFLLRFLRSLLFLFRLRPQAALGLSCFSWALSFPCVPSVPWTLIPIWLRPTARQTP